MTLELYSTILTVGSVGIFLSLLGLLVASLTTKSGKTLTSRIRYEQYIALIAAISVASIIFSLTYQLVYETPVCELCWWQRIFLYPVSVISLVALWFRTRETHITTAILAGFGLYIACYHYYYHFQGYVLGKTLSIPCSFGGLLPACTNSPILVFGFVTIPFMGIMVFGSFLILAWFAFKVANDKNLSSEKESLRSILTVNRSTPESLETQKIEVTTLVAKSTDEKGPHLLYGAMAIAVVLVIVGFLFTRGYIVAATVNGSPISRIALNERLERQDGKQTLEAMINEKALADEFARLGITVEPNAVAEQIKKIEAQIAAQGGTLDDALLQQGMTMDMLEQQIDSQLKVEKALGEKIKVTDEEVVTFVTENGIEIPDGEPVETFNQEIKEQLKQQKLQTEVQAWISEVIDKATIKYYVRY
jgi:disulfide bond formation protein DsbB